VDAVGRVQRWGETREDVVGAAGEEAQERGMLAAAVERGEATQELGIGDEAGPSACRRGKHGGGRTAAAGGGVKSHGGDRRRLARAPAMRRRRRHPHQTLAHLE
jgi:hypothetical protein